MKWFAIAAFAALAAAPITGSAQRIVPISEVPHVEDKAPTLWGLGGYDLIYFENSDSRHTPFERMEVADARTVEILSRVQAPPLRPSDIRSENRGGRTVITVRNWLLLEVSPQDAKAGKSVSGVADSWVSTLKKVLIKVAPRPSQTGV